MIEQLFGSKTRIKLLYLLFQFPHKSFYVREMAREVGSQLNAVRRELANLEKIGLIASVSGKQLAQEQYSGQLDNSRAKYYRLRRDCLFYSELKSLLLKVRILKEREMIEKIKQKAGKLKLLILTGVFTEADSAATDILLVGEVKPVVLSKIINSFEKKLGKTIRYTVMAIKEFQERKEIGDKFLYSIFESKHLLVLDEL